MTPSLHSVGKITLLSSPTLIVINIDVEVRPTATVAHFERPIDDGARICGLPHTLAVWFDS
jgi:hypothetical protein